MGRPHFQWGAELPTWLSPGDQEEPHSRDSDSDSRGAKTGAAELPAPGQEDKRGRERLCQAKQRQRPGG